MRLQGSVGPRSRINTTGRLLVARSRGVFEAYGIMGQTISINSGEDLIYVQHAAWADSGQDEDYGHEAALKAAVTAALKGH